MQKPEWQIAVILNPMPQIIRIPLDARSFYAFGKRFEDVGLGYHNGFYDFLRTGSGSVIGLRFDADFDASELLERITPSQHLQVKFAKPVVLLIFWGESQSFDPKKSTDQYFGNNRIYRAGASRTLAAGFSILHLSDSEKAYLEATSDLVS